jgi:hypothetical protein
VGGAGLWEAPGRSARRPGQLRVTPCDCRSGALWQPAIQLVELLRLRDSLLDDVDRAAVAARRKHRDQEGDLDGGRPERPTSV